MTVGRQVFLCQKCGNMVEVLRAAAGTLACCGQPMTACSENTTDASQEKHVPVVARTQGEITISVGVIPHPMDPDHHIEWIELADGPQLLRYHLEPGKAPMATFPWAGDRGCARAYCNLHGLWRGEA